MYSLGLSVGKIRGLEQIADESGIIRVVAMDQRGSLATMLNPAEPEKIGFNELRDTKLILCKTLAPYCSAVLLDPQYGATQAITENILPGKIGLIVSLEKSGFSGKPNTRLTEIIPGWSVEKIKRMGASAVKLLVYYNPGSETAAITRELVSKVADECFFYDIPCLVETLVYPLKGDDNFPGYQKEKAGLVLQAAEDITDLGIDLYKAEFPLVPSNDIDHEKAFRLCSRLTETAKVPWVILSAGMEFEIFEKAVEIACKAGASGFIAGRAIWKDAFKLPDKQRQLEYLNNQAISNIKRLNEIATSYAHPWFKNIKAFETGKDWFNNYPGFDLSDARKAAGL